MKKIITIILTLCTFVLMAPVGALSPDQTLVEKILSENRNFIEFANVCVSNLGTDANIKQLKDANQRNYNANLSYLESNYTDAFKEIRMSQEILRDLFLDILKNKYIEDARILLDTSAPIIIQSKDKRSEMFLRLGYRDLEVSRQFREMGYNYNRFLFSNKIRYYIDGIKRARRSKRFAFLALIESKTPTEEKNDYHTQTYDEYRSPNEDKDNISDYERVKIMMTNQLNRKLYDDTYNYFLHHDDDYSILSRMKVSVLKDAYKEMKATRAEKKAINPDYPTNDQPKEKPADKTPTAKPDPTKKP